jgi:tripartite-type tricarboxylate transporter receptor subunit TctC
MFETTLATAGYIRSGKLRALAVTSTTRSEALPDIPTMAEFVPGYEATAWFGLAAPKDTPVDIVERLNTAVTAALADPKIGERLADLGGVPMPMSAAEFGRHIANETEKWARIVRSANMKAE